MAGKKKAKSASYKKASTKGKWASTNKSVKKTKVPANNQNVKVLYLKCSNCGEEDEKALFCPHCDSPIDEVEIKEKSTEEAENDIEAAKVASGSKPSADDDEVTESDLLPKEDDVDSLIEGGLGEIFGDSGDSAGAVGDLGGDDSGEDVSLQDAIDILDQE